MHALAAAVCALFSTSCIFQADYEAGRIRCSDNICPSNLTCQNGICVAPGAVDGGSDATSDARPAALTCADPGPVPPAGGTVMGTTIGRGATVGAMCDGFVMNGRDAVYRIDLPSASQLLVDIAGGRKAYVLTACMPSPATPTCASNTLATSGNPLGVSAAAGPIFIVVDDENPAAESTYTLVVTVN